MVKYHVIRHFSHFKPFTELTMISLIPPYIIDLELQGIGIWKIFPKSDNPKLFISSILYCCENPNRLVQDHLKKSLKSTFKLTDLFKDEVIVSFNKSKCILTNYRLIVDEFNHFYSIPLQNIVFWNGLIQQEEVISTNSLDLNDSFLYYLDKKNEVDSIKKEILIPFLSQEILDSLIKKVTQTELKSIGLLDKYSLVNPNIKYDELINKMVEYSKDEYDQNIHHLKAHINSDYQTRGLITAVVTDII